MDGSRTERDHLASKSEGYWKLAAAMGEMVCEWVKWATGSCNRDGCSLGIGDGSTLGGGTTLDGDGCSIGIGDGSTLGGGTTFGGGVAVGLADGSTSTVLVLQWEKRSRSLEIADSCLWWIVVEASLMAQDRKLRACTILSSEVTYGWVR